ncbi:hypothetical protein DVH05_022852 [Phytophthora capsici]|nr:hypothetical protein DVH05_022852 [Phytophthora capsici]
MVESTSPIQPKIPRSGDLGNNLPAQTSATSHSLPHRTGVNGQDQPDNLTMLELPDIPVGISSRGYAMIKQDGEEQLRQLVENVGDVPYPTVTNLWSCWEAPSEIIEDKAVKEAGEEKKLVPATGLLRVHCSWSELPRSGKRFLYDDSCNLLKKMTRAITQQMLFKKDIVVPNIFEGSWGRSLCGARFPESLTGCGGGFQQLLLPSDIVQDDEAKLADAPAKIIRLADSNLRCLRRSDVSLTRASMNIPSLWNLKITTDRMKGLVAEKLEMLAPQLTPASPTIRSNKSIQEKTEVLELPPDSLSTPIRNDGQDINMLRDQPQITTAKLKVVAEDKPLSTDYFLSDKFLKCNWSEPLKEDHENGTREEERVKEDQLLQQFARPAMWDLMGKKLLKVGGPSFAHALDGVSLETLQAIIYQQLPKVKQMSLNPSVFTTDETIEVCASLRQAIWLHTLRILSIDLKAGARGGEELSTILARILPSIKYKLALGSSNWKDLHTLVQAIGFVVPSDELIECADAGAVEESSMLQPPPKKLKVLPATKEMIPVRTMCSITFLEKDELLDELCTEHQIFFIERDLPPPIDILVDERNSICVVDEATFQEEEIMRRFIFNLAHLQVQQQKCWIVITSALGTNSVRATVLSSPIAAETEKLLNLFLAALVQFRIEIQVLTCFSCEEAGRFLRAIVDECADVALNDYRILPRLWFERPFLLEEESQLERFLVSTKVVNHYAAQSLLQKICVDDLFSKSLDELKLLVQNAVTDDQLQLLWRLVQQNHGLSQTNYYSRS